MGGGGGGERERERGHRGGGRGRGRGRGDQVVQTGRSYWARVTLVVTWGEVGGVGRERLWLEVCFGLYSKAGNANCMEMIVGVLMSIQQFIGGGLTLLLWPQAEDGIYGGDNDDKERWFSRHLGASPLNCNVRINWN